MDLVVINDVGVGVMTKRLIRVVSALLILSSFFYTNAVYALNLSTSGAVDAASMLVNLSTEIPNLMRFVTALAYVMGFFFVFKGILSLKEFGESRTMMSSQHSLSTPLLYLFVGSALIYLPSTVQTGLSTFWDTPDIYGYVSSGGDPWDELINACFMVIQLIGVIAFIRGLIILTHLGGQGQPGQFGRAMAHIVGGILCLNLYQFLQAIVSTLGIGQLT